MLSQTWKPKVDQNIQFNHEKRKAYNVKAMAGNSTWLGTLTPSVIAHLIKEISRYTRFIVEHRAIINTFVVSPTHCNSLLIQGGLKYPIK